MLNNFVTVAVTTYNCDKYVVETLESIFNQEYLNIELIISDDFSVDNTIIIVNNWISEKRVRQRFSRITFLTVEKNTGVSANCNRCIKNSNSNWIKFIAGDDILLPNCISANMQFAEENPEAKIIFSAVKIYEHTFDEDNLKEITPPEYPFNLMDPNFSARRQWEILLEGDRIHYTPSYFFHRKALEEVGFYDEKNRLVEDYPMWLKLTKAGNKLYFFKEVTVGYRKYKFLNEEEKSKPIFNSAIVKGFESRKQFAHPYLNVFRVKQEYWIYFISLFFLKFDLNINKFGLGIFYYFSTIYGNPFFYLDAMYRFWYKTPLKG